jgi:hypothetical protein
VGVGDRVAGSVDYSTGVAGAEIHAGNREIEER